MIAAHNINQTGGNIMTVDLQMLVWVALLSVLQTFPYVLALIGKVGLVKAASYPQPDIDDCPDWVKRAKKCHGNMVENIAPFAAVVLVVHVAGAANATSALGATIFFWSRVVMVVGHTGAIPFVRTLGWAASLAGLLMIALQVL